MLRCDTWTGTLVPKAGMGFLRKKFAAAAVAGKILVAGGCTRSSVVEEYDPDENVWRVVSDRLEKVWLHWGFSGWSVLRHWWAEDWAIRTRRLGVCVTRLWCGGGPCVRKLNGLIRRGGACVAEKPSSPWRRVRGGCLRRQRQCLHSLEPRGGAIILEIQRVEEEC
ncbi:UNVERIFIED_CONTAM: hypothetical protein Sangu_0417800 [Sesamum angustifolium]|uniref:Uncharacterized protein n=1 Tax=Sesamum angustifolium TaxID=2727405 RepID=A0AAW2QTP7_9LAMI